MKILKIIYDYISNYREQVETEQPEELGIGALVTGDAERLYDNICNLNHRSEENE